MYRRKNSQRTRSYAYEQSHYPALCPVGNLYKHKGWDPTITVTNLEEIVLDKTDIFNNNSIEAEEIIKSLEERTENYKWEDDMRYGINRMDEWDRGYYEGNPYIYGWEYDKMYSFTEELDPDVEDELD